MALCTGAQEDAQFVDVQAVLSSIRTTHDTSGNCLFFNKTIKLFSNRKNYNYHFQRAPLGYDLSQNQEVGDKNIALEHLEEAYTTENWIVSLQTWSDSLSFTCSLAYLIRCIRIGGCSVID